MSSPTVRTRFAPSPTGYLHVGTSRTALYNYLFARRHQGALEDYRAQGYLPEAMVNYMALLGWGYDETREHFSLADLERLFSIERVSRSPAMFDNQKLEALKAWYIRQLPPEDLAERLQPFLARAGHPDADLDLLTRTAPLISARITRLDQGPDMLGFLLDEVELDPAEAAKVLNEEARGFLDAVAKVLQPLEPWTAEAIEHALRELAGERGLKPRKAFQPVRLAITGRLVSPPLFESMELLGRDRSLARLERAKGLGALR